MIREPWRTIIAAVLTAFLSVLGGVTVTQVSGCCTSTIPTIHDPDKPPPDDKPDPLNAIGKIAMQGGYCSGTVVGPRRSDGRWLIVSASHCFKRVGEDATFITRDGISRKITVIAIDRKPDIAICSTDTGQGKMSFTYIADGTPPGGTAIWHAGFGQDRPANREDGKVIGGPDNNGQVQYELSVSPGDSGGGIVTDSDGHLLSPVCCTTNLAARGRVWGGSPEMIRRMIATPTDFIDLKPIDMPPPPQQMPPPK